MIDDRIFTELREAPAPPLAEVRRRVSRRRSRRRWVRGGAVVLGIVAVFLLLPGVRDRGVGDLPLVSLDAVAEGPHGARPLANGAVVAADERVVFFVRASVGGEATLREVDGAASVPVVPGPWTVDAGETVPGGDSPLSWRPDRPVDRVRYDLSVCAAPDRCGVDTLTLRWAP